MHLWNKTQSDESNSSRSRSATPECPELLDSERLKTSMENLLNPVDWMDKAPPIPSVVVKADYLSNDRSLSTQSSLSCDEMGPHLYANYFLEFIRFIGPINYMC